MGRTAATRCVAGAVQAPSQSWTRRLPAAGPRALRRLRELWVTAPCSRPPPLRPPVFLRRRRLLASPPPASPPTAALAVSPRVDVTQHPGPRATGGGVSKPRSRRTSGAERQVAQTGARTGPASAPEPSAPFLPAGPEVPGMARVAFGGRMNPCVRSTCFSSGFLFSSRKLRGAVSPRPPPGTRRHLGTFPGSAVRRLLLSGGPAPSPLPCRAHVSRSRAQGTQPPTSCRVAAKLSDDPVAGAEKTHQTAGVPRASPCD